MYISPRTSIHVETTKQAVSITSIPFSTYAATDMSIITYLGKFGISNLFLSHCPVREYFCVKDKCIWYKL